MKQVFGLQGTESRALHPASSLTIPGCTTWTRMFQLPLSRSAAWCWAASSSHPGNSEKLRSSGSSQSRQLLVRADSINAALSGKSQVQQAEGSDMYFLDSAESPRTA